MKYLDLNNGVKIPQVGLGTFLIPKENIDSTIAKAYELGYRQFDTAWRYYNEEDIAKAFKNHGIKREDVFLTTKVNVDALYWFKYHEGKRAIFNVFRRQSIKSAIMQSFKQLGGGKELDYIDLFLVHYPWPMYLDMYEELTKLYHQGRIRAIGVSNFLPQHIESLKEVSDVVPAVNEVELSPLNSQKRLIKWCQDRGIQMTAMSTFSHFRSCEPRMEIIEHPSIIPIAKKHGKSVVQVVLRWLLQQNVAVIPKTWNFDHLKENISIFDFELSADEMAIIDSLDGGKWLNYHPDRALKNVPQKYREFQW